MRMDDRRVYSNDRSSKVKIRSNRSAVNTQHAAFADHQNIWVYDNFQPQKAPLKIRHGNGKNSECLAIAISSAPSYLLALAKGHRIFVFDVESGTRTSTLRGNGHQITAVCFSCSNPDLVATGAADGSVCIWSLSNVILPIHCLYGNGSACCSLTFDALDHDMLFMGQTGRLLMWNVQTSATVSFYVKSRQTADLLLQHVANTKRIVAASKDGLLEIWDVRHLHSGRDSSSVESGSDDSLEDRKRQYERMPQFKGPMSFTFGFPIIQVELIGRSGLVVLPENGLLVLFYAMTVDHTPLAEVWRLPSGHRLFAISVQVQQAQGFLLTYGPAGQQTHRIPDSICEHFGWNLQAQEYHAGFRTRQPPKKSVDQQEHAMVPELISQPPGDGPFRKPVRRDLLPQRARVKAASNKSMSRPSTARSAAQTEILDLPPLTDSLDLPALGASAKNSYIPFLSPNIPASRELPIEVGALDESLHLPPLARESFNSATTTTANDSDSDDDAISGPLISSGTLLPGGVNVPLPRTCGAIFAPSGDLVVFFPSKPRSMSVADEQQPPVTDQNESQELEVTRLFPTFGNLNFVSSSVEDSLSDSGSIISADSNIVGAQKLGLQASSFDSRHKWNRKALPTPAKAGPLLNETKVKVSVYDQSTLSLLRRDLAGGYRLVRKDDETHMNLCNFNGEKAMIAGLPHVADIWATLALSLQRDDGISNKFEGSQILNSPACTQTAGFPFENTNGCFGPGLSLSSSVLRACSSSLENAWIIRRLVGWAERQGDIQTLTNIVVIVLLSSEEALQGAHDSLTAISRAKIPVDTQRDGMCIQDDNTASNANMFMRPNSTDSGHMNDFSVKESTSAASSRNPSQPPTPYLHSALSTPPLIFSATSRRNTRLSASGSVSPEHSRSSFSAAAKYYAQSITDKFASGTSPPAKKTGTSPSQELSSSLPATSSSYTKSVSFVSVDSTVSNRRRGLGIVGDDPDSDDDKTIDENSHPHTPKSIDLSVPILWHQKNEMIDQRCQSTEMSAALEEMKFKSRIWCGYYAELLRSWDMVFEATELEKIGGVATTASHLTNNREVGPDVQPVPIADRKYVTCNLCDCLIKTAQQGCPACGHTTHPKCLVSYLESLVSVDFTCPTGCGCDCTTAPEATFVDGTLTARQSPNPTPAPQSVNRKVMKKRASLTDPRRVRSRLEGESW